MADDDPSDRAWFGTGTPTGARLYVIPQAGGGAAAVTELRRALAPGVTAVPVRAPYRESRIAEPLPESLSALAAELAERIETHSGGEPFLILGHCSGAFLAYETAVRLDGSRGLAGLVVSAQVAPERFAPVRTHTMSPKGFRAYVAEHGLVPSEVLAAPLLWELLEPTLRADLRLYEEYRPSEHALTVPVLAVHGRHDRRFPAAAAQAWSSRTTGGFYRLTVERDHDYLGSHPEEFAAALTDALVRFAPAFESLG
ncbi:thioesterase II family protein [Streptomyces sp. JNUCC 64]